MKIFSGAVKVLSIPESHTLFFKITSGAVTDGGDGI